MKELANLTYCFSDFLLPFFVLVTPAGLRPVSLSQELHAGDIILVSLASTLQILLRLAVLPILHHSSPGVAQGHHVLNPLGLAFCFLFFLVSWNPVLPLLSWTAQWHRHQTLHLLEPAPAPVLSESPVRHVPPRPIPSRPSPRKARPGRAAALKTLTFHLNLMACISMVVRCGIL